VEHFGKEEDLWWTKTYKVFYCVIICVYHRLKPGLHYQSFCDLPFTSEIVGSILATDSCMTLMWKESVNALPKVVGFLRVLQFPPTGNVDRVGWDYPPNWPFHRSCAPWSDMSHKVTARGALRKPSTWSGWAASFAIQLSAQLQVRMILPPPPLPQLTYCVTGFILTCSSTQNVQF
jgi:hypothetical protein